MHEIIAKLRTKTAEEASEYILKKWSEKGFCIVNYLYGANITARKLFENTTSRYYEALKTCDILLPDGIALQIFVRFYFWKFKKKKVRIPNLNGTDFLPYFLNKIRKNYDVKLILYGARPDVVEKNALFLRSQGYDVVYYQDGYREFDWKKFEMQKIENLKKTNAFPEKQSDERLKKLYLFIQGRSTLRNPLQELRTLENIHKIKEHNLIVCNQSGTLEYKERGGGEKRAPKRIRKVKLERLRRTIVNPKKGIGKVLATISLFWLILSKIVLQTTEKKVNENEIPKANQSKRK